MTGDFNENIANQPDYLKRQAKEALKAAKMLEAQRKAAGFKWVRFNDRSWRLVK